MSDARHDRNLLFGILAVQMDFISRDALVCAMNAWVLAKDKPLGEILAEQKALAGDRRSLLEALVQEHLKQHGGDPEKSLAAVSSIGSVREDLRQIDDPQVQASLVHLPATSPAADPDATRAQSVGSSTSSGTRFRILRPHAEGGLGKVSVARDEELSREVALKEIKERHADDQDSRSRFLMEAEITGGLEHPSIVPVYGLGQYADGRPYYAMRFIRGDSLKEAVDRFHDPQAEKSNPGERALQLRKLLGRFLDVCNAIAYAHSRGVLHRDLKPGNIMLGQYGETLVVDWGLAKAVDRPELKMESSEGLLRLSSGSGSAATQMGSALGTPQYMSPEQAAGRLDLLGPASDVYGLGATLYYVLTGKPPIQAEDVGAVLNKVERGEFRPPRAVNPEIAPPLEAICLKAMALKPADRYSSPRTLAEDVEHWLADEPVAAHRDSILARLARAARRHKVATAAIAALLLAAIVGLSIGTVLLGREQVQTDRARQAAVANFAKAEAAQNEAEGERRIAVAARQATERTLIDTYVTSGLCADERDDLCEAFLWFAEAARLAVDEPERRGINLLRAANWQNRILVPCRAFPHQRLPQANYGLYRTLAFDASGQYLLAFILPDQCAVWDVERESKLSLEETPKSVSGAQWSPDGHWLVLGSADGEARVYGVPDFQLAHRVKTQGPIRAIAFSRDGRYLALAGGSLARVCDLQAHDLAGPEFPHPQAVATVQFNDQGNRLATACGDGQARVFALPGGTDPGPGVPGAAPLFSPVPHRLGSLSAIVPTFVDGGRGLLTCADGTRLVWSNAETGKPARSIVCPAGNSPLNVLALSPDRRYLALAWESGVQMWDVGDEKPHAVGPFLRPEGTALDAAFDATGKMLVTCGHGLAADFWSVPEGDALYHRIMHGSIVHRVAFSPHPGVPGARQLVASAEEIGLVRIWKLPRENPGDYRIAVDGTTRAVLSADGRHFITAGVSYRNGTLLTARVYDAATGKPAGPPIKPGGIVIDAAMSCDGQHAATASSPATTQAGRSAAMFLPDGKAGSVRVWNWKTGEAIVDPIAMPSEPRSLDYSPDGKLVACICAEGEVVVLDAVSGRIAEKMDSGVRAGHYQPNLHVANCSVRFSPDGRNVVTWEMGNTVQVWNPADGKLRYAPLSHDGRVWDVQFSPDARFLVTAAADDCARVWDLATGRLAAAPLSHPYLVDSARFSPDGRQMLTTCGDCAERLWDWQAGRLLAPPHQSEGVCYEVRFSPDERSVVTANYLGFARLLDRHTLRLVAPRMALKGIALSVAVTPDSGHAVVAGFGGTVYGFGLADLLHASDEDPEELCLLAELASGRCLQEGAVVRLTPEEWMRRWHTFREKFPQSTEMQSQKRASTVAQGMGASY
jgi:WD40 repeat protein/tRNA A-37 threonylcarbamoyl transferase component Bud32